LRPLCSRGCGRGGCAVAVRGSRYRDEWPFSTNAYLSLPAAPRTPAASRPHAGRRRASSARVYTGCSRRRERWRIT
jgi:hypothetical protein